MEVVARLRNLLQERGWSEYRLAKEAGLSQTTITNLFKRNNLPTLPTLEAICRAFDMTLAQFFMEDDFVEITPAQKDLLKKWNALHPEQKRIIQKLLNAIYEENQGTPS